jgi:hypothetical protein
MIAEKFKQLRAKLGGLKAEQKDGVRFKVKSADVLVAKLRPALDELDLVLFPAQAKTQGQVHEYEVERRGNQEFALATSASVEVEYCLGAPDGSYVNFTGFGQGADNQDKAGGKAFTYALKAACVQAFNMPNAEYGVGDTDDTDTPISGGKKRKSKAQAATKQAVDEVIADAEAKGDLERLRTAVQMAGGLPADEQTQAAEAIRAAAARIRAA